MFNRIIVAPQPRSVTNYTSITERRAPTDESIRLLREMEGAAEKEIVKSVKVGDTRFECVVHVIRDQVSMDTICRAIFSLNGKQMSADSRTSDYNTTTKTMVDALIAAIAEELAREIVRPALRGFFFKG